MCGIAGWARMAPEMPDVSRLTRMCDVLSHRGPDDAGVFVSSDGRVGLGNRRLSIIDLSPRGHQPMANESGTVWITYNGEVYNFRPLRHELERQGYTFRSDTDTEVLLHAYEHWGTACPQKFNGMFAFAIYDTKGERLILVRDRFGVKPLYYAWNGTELVFASETKAILASGISARLQRENVAELFLYSGLSGERTLFAGVKSLRPGSILVLSLRDGHMASRAFYAPRDKVEVSRYAAAERRSASENESVLRELLLSSVERRLISDVPVGTLCSGGLDSSLVTAVARTFSRDVRLFNVSSKGFVDMDEVDYARAVARHLGTELIVYEVDRKDLQRGFVDAAYFNDDPLTIINSVPMLYISSLARDHGVKVLLSGEGADELFAGYDWRHLALLRGLRWRRRWALVPRPLRKLLAGTGLGNEVLYKHRFKTLERNIDDVIRLTSGAFERTDRRHRDIESYAFIGDPVEEEVQGTLLSDLHEYLEPLLMRQDRMTMAASVECRLPFLDYTVVEFALNLPLQLKLQANQGKWILKRVAERYLPRDVVYRPKKGFPVPAAAFLYDDLDFSIFENGFWENYFDLSGDRCRRTILEAGRHSFLWYHFLMLEIWGRIFLNHERRDEIRERAFRAPRS